MPNDLRAQIAGAITTIVDAWLAIGGRAALSREDADDIAGILECAPADVRAVACELRIEIT